MLTPWVAGLFPVPHSPRSPECSSHSWRAVARAPFIEPVHDSDAGEIDHHHVYFSPPWSIPSPHTGKETTEKVNNFPQASQWANNVRDGIWAHACLIPKCVLWICSNTLSVARRSGFGTFLNSSFLSCSPYNSFYNSLYVLFLFLLFLSLHILPSLKKNLVFLTNEHWLTLSNNTDTICSDKSLLTFLCRVGWVFLRAHTIPLLQHCWNVNHKPTSFILYICLWIIIYIYT